MPAAIAMKRHDPLPGLWRILITVSEASSSNITWHEPFKNQSLDSFLSNDGTDDVILE